VVADDDGEDVSRLMPGGAVEGHEVGCGQGYSRNRCNAAAPKHYHCGSAYVDTEDSQGQRIC
jgi:hypothetical protein